MPDLRSGEYVWAEGETRPEDKDPSIKAENKPGHKPLAAYKLPRWCFHPELPTKYGKLYREDYAGCCVTGTGNREEWTVAHVAGYHDDLKLLLLAKEEELTQKTTRGYTPVHFACVGGDHCHASQYVLAYLVECGAYEEVKDVENEFGRTPLEDTKHFLVKEEIDIVERILKGWKPPIYDEYLEQAHEKRVPGKALQDAQAALPAVAPDPDTLPVGLLFPGQGSQYVKMLSDDKDHKVIKQMLKTAEDILGYDLLKVCMEGPEDKLEQTKFCQPAMYVAGLAAMAKLRDSAPDKVDKCQAVAGLSLGEYSALAAAGVFTFAEGLKLVKLRGEAMQEASETGAKQGMISVAGLEEQALQAAIAKAKGSDVLQISNFLFPKGFSVGGHMTAVERLEPLAKQSGALQAKVLKTGGAFHTPLMKSAQDKLTKALESALPIMKPPRCPVYMNTTGKRIPAGTDPKVIVKMLSDQLTTQVLWEPSMKAMIADGVKEFYELGPMKQLKAMIKRIDAGAWDKMINVAV